MKAGTKWKIYKMKIRHHHVILEDPKEPFASGVSGDLCRDVGLHRVATLCALVTVGYFKVPIQPGGGFLGLKEAG